MKKHLFFDNEDITYPKGSNNLRAYGSFYFRDIYDCYVFRDAKVDLWYDKEFQFFGRVNHDKQAVVVSEADLRQLPNTKETILVLPPIAEAFRQMTEYINRSVFKGEIEKEGSLLGEIKAKRGFESAHKSYKDYNSAMYATFTGDFMNSVRDRKFTNFESFIEIYLDFFLRTGTFIPWTREGFLLSRRSTPLYSGMCIEIDKGDHSDDKLKGKYINDKNFNFFKKVAGRYGFMLDKNAPWRLIPDFNSRGMVRAMKKTGTSPEKFYDDYFVKAYEWELQNFKHFLWGWYNSYVSANPYVQIINLDRDSTEPELEKRESYTEEQLFSRYSDHYFIKLYIYMRAVETNQGWEQGTFDRVVHRAREILRYQGLKKAMLYVHKNIDPCSAKTTRELFDQKSLTRKALNAILLEGNKKYQNPFSYY